jgi:hypothetical protein
MAERGRKRMTTGSGSFARAITGRDPFDEGNSLEHG